VQNGLPPGRQASGREIGIRIADEQHHLEKHHARRPYRGGAAEPRENLLGDDRLHEEQQKCAEKYGAGVKNHSGC
jgi:hypothetical protein